MQICVKSLLIYVAHSCCQILSESEPIEVNTTACTTWSRWSFAVKEPHWRLEHTTCSWSTAASQKVEVSWSAHNVVRNNEGIPTKGWSFTYLRRFRFEFLKTFPKHFCSQLYYFWIHNSATLCNISRPNFSWPNKTTFFGWYLQHFPAKLFSADFCNISRPNFNNFPAEPSIFPGRNTSQFVPILKNCSESS